MWLIVDAFEVAVAVLEVIVLWRVYVCLGLSLLAGAVVYFVFPAIGGPEVLAGVVGVGTVAGGVWELIHLRRQRKKALPLVREAGD